MADMPVAHVTVVYSATARHVDEVQVHVPAASTLQQALDLSGVLQKYPALRLDALDVGVWGKPAELGQGVHDGDRIEIYRPLTVDPKVARRTRFKGQGARATGLFAQKRQGAKAGYGG